MTYPVRDPKYEVAREKIANAALLPSRVWKDTSVWTDTADGKSRRTLLVGGRFAAGRYALDASRVVPWPDEPAASRHVIDLIRLGDDEFAWDTEVAYAIGDAAAADVRALFGALLAAGEGRDEAAVRADYQRTVPRTAAVLGLLFRVDSIKTAHLPDSSTLATYAVTMTPTVLARQYPDFAKYLTRYVESARMRWSVADRAGVPFLDAGMRDGRIQFRVRTRGGRVVAMAGPPRPMPDSLVLHGDMTVKVRLFTVGIRRYESALTLVRGAHQTGFTVVSRQEPHWVLPLVTERLLRSPLRRPFRGEGTLFGMSVHDSTGQQTILLRKLHLEVEESAILRFIGRLSSIAVGDFAGEVEQQELAWFREVFTALVADARALSF